MRIERELLEKLKPFLKKKKGYALTIKKRLQDKGLDYSPQSIYATVAGRMANTDILTELVKLVEEEKQKEKELQEAIRMATS
jgi:hypothetical protein